jgi:hypothetical protein
MVGRQVLGNYSAELASQAAEAWRAKDRERFEAQARRMLRLIDDVDQLLGSRPEFLLGTWISDARRWGESDAEKDRLEWNARRVITMWGEKTLIRDYSRRDWSGMLSGFYKKRWAMFFEALSKSLDSSMPFDPADFDQKLQQWEREWARADERFPAQPKGGTVKISRRLWTEYSPEIRKSFEPDAPSLTTGKPATASSALPGHHASKANDGRKRNTDNYWATDVNNDSEPWWQVDFEQPTTVGRVVIVGFFGDQRIYGFLVEGSNDGQTWEIVADQRDNEVLSSRDGYSCSFPPREIRFLRVRQTSNSANTGRHLVEVLAFKS